MRLVAMLRRLPMLNRRKNPVQRYHTSQRIRRMSSYITGHTKRIGSLLKHSPKGSVNRVNKARSLKSFRKILRKQYGFRIKGRSLIR